MTDPRHVYLVMHCLLSSHSFYHHFFQSKIRYLQKNHTFLSSNRKMQKSCTSAVNAMTCWTVSTRPLANGSRLWKQQRTVIASICAPPTTIMPNTSSPWATRPVLSHSKTKSVMVLCQRCMSSVYGQNYHGNTVWFWAFLFQLWEFRYTQSWSAQNAPRWHIISRELRQQDERQVCFSWL